MGNHRYAKESLVATYAPRMEYSRVFFLDPLSKMHSARVLDHFDGSIYDSIGAGINISLLNSYCAVSDAASAKLVRPNLGRSRQLD
jgi:hypothetical protein